MEDDIFLEEDNLTDEERAYIEAEGLMDSADCITRYIKKADVLRIAAEGFEKLGNYKDSIKKAAKCRKDIEEVLSKGKYAAYQEITAQEEKAVSKFEYLTVISDYEELGDYRDCSERITKCKDKVIKLEKKACSKRRAIAVAIVIVVIAALTRTPLYPMAKGMYFEHKHQYTKAVECYSQASLFPTAEKLMHKCYYIKAVKEYRRNNYELAMKFFIKADTYQNAQKRAVVLEKEYIKESKAGDCVTFGPCKWIVLENNGKKVFLVKKAPYKTGSYDAYGNDWSTSRVRVSLNTTYIMDKFTEYEKALISKTINETNMFKTRTSDKVFLLSKEEYIKYASYLGGFDKAWWLRTAADTNSIVKGGGDINKLSTYSIFVTASPDYDPDSTATIARVTKKPEETPTLKPGQTVKPASEKVCCVDTNGNITNDTAVNIPDTTYIRPALYIDITK